MFLKAVDQRATKAEIRDALLAIAASNGQPLSDARADKLANKFKKGEFDPNLARILQYQDPTGELAVHIDECDRVECRTCGRSAADIYAPGALAKVPA